MEIIIDIRAILLSFLLQNPFEVGPDQINIDDLQCMTMNIYHEARGEPVQGQIAVGNVVINRVDDPAYPNTVCGVIYQNKQFSWYSDGKPDTIHYKGAFKEAAELSLMLLAGYIDDNTDGALHYYNPNEASPKWANTYDYRIVYANHIFLIN